MTPRQYRSTIEMLGLTQAAAAKFLGVTSRTSCSYANHVEPPKPTAMLLKLMVRLKLKPKDVE